MEHIACYGTGNERRLTGAHETAKLTESEKIMFSSGNSHGFHTQIQFRNCFLSFLIYYEFLGGRFTYGVGNRGASVRIGNDTEDDGKGNLKFFFNMLFFKISIFEHNFNISFFFIGVEAILRTVVLPQTWTLTSSLPRRVSHFRF